MKRVVIMILLLVLCSGINVFAFEYPMEFWEVSGEYEDAVNSNNYPMIIEYGMRIVEIMMKETNTPEKRNTIINAYKKVGDAYAELENYAKSVETFKKMTDYAAQFGDEFYDNLRDAHERINQFTSEISMYTDNGTSVYYGAKNEKSNGVLFGICWNGETRKKLQNESMILTYQELGQTLSSYNANVLKNASSKGCAVEFALNCPKQGRDIENIDKMDRYLKEISQLFAKYSDVPVYLRFAAEFDSWDVLAEADDFKSAFRYVSEYFKKRNSNVAIVWSPNQASNWYVDIDDYYPGDKYVDWVGMSLYAKRYFKGDRYQSEANEIIFKTGINSDPVIAVKDIVEKYGDRKPIMISESGCGHRLVKSGEDTADFALRRLKEYFAYLPMIYPEIKLMAYFDWHVDAESEKDDFRLSTNEALQKEYINLVKGARFIQNGYNSTTDYCNKKVQHGTVLGSVFEVSCYAHLYGTQSEKVTYFIDDKYVGMSGEVPFKTYIDATQYPGNHVLKAVAEFENGKTMTTESNVFIENMNGEITVEISGDEVIFDQEPIIYKSRTMVPMRKIFERLGAKVSWDSNTQTVSGKKGDRTVKVAVGDKTMYVNNKKISLDTAPLILSGRTLVPARAVAEGLGCEVDWDSRYRVVSVTPKVFRWSEWEKSLPDDVDSDLFYIESRDEYRYKTREREYFTRDYYTPANNFVEERISYGSWSGWQNDYISESDSLEVESRIETEPKRYHYLHYCTGLIKDEANKYRTRSYWWHDECDFHDLGWFDSPLPYSEDSTSDYAYFVDGKRYRCSNTCYRWYLVETTGGDYYQYRSRPIYREYEYWQWGYWSDWSDWSKYEPDDDDYDIDMEIDERTVYRYKEKG